MVFHDFFLFRKRASFVVFYTGVLLLWIGSSNLLAECFVPPKVSVTPGRSISTISRETMNHHNRKRGRMHTIKHESFLSMMPPQEIASITNANSVFFLLSEDVDSIASANAALEGVRTFFTVIAGLALAFVGLTYATVTFIIPKASEQLERDTKRLRPGLWEEFEAKLGEGETMATRPDLLQELGNIMQPIIMEDFERSANAKDSKSSARSSSTKKRLDNDQNQWRD
mmetsp:Transcript_9812/g.18457  ORF Transcript_9812/g.18457 Transcript_9812/m.18457 type:complete len:227 (+) Transcript_9812:161-841(+)